MLVQKNIHTLKQRPSQYLQKIFHLTCLNVEDLKTLIEFEISQNPFLEIKEYKKEQSYFEEHQKELDFNNSLSDLKNEDEFFFNSFFMIYKNQKETPHSSSRYREILFEASVLLNKNEKKIAKILFTHLSPKGYLDSSIQSLSEKYNLSEVLLTDILKKLQKLEPRGLFARNLQERLLLQIDSNDLLLKTILTDYYWDFLKKNFYSICKDLSIPFSLLQKKIEILKKSYQEIRLNDNDSTFIEPDIFVYKEEKKWKFQFNEKILPKVSYNQFYDQKNKSFYYFYKSAKDLLKCLEERKILLRKVFLIILKKQISFFYSGSLNPLTIYEIAETLKIHPSTVYKALANKWLQTPLGLFPAKFFISRPVNENISKEKALSLLKSLIQTENKKKPLSDQKLAKEFAKRKISISRRWITKQRKKLQILSSRARKKGM